MSRDAAKGYYDRQPGEPPSAYVATQDAKDAIDVTYDDFEDRIWQGTQSAYDQIPVKNPMILYVVTG